MLKKLVLLQVVLLSVQTLMYFGCERFEYRIHDVKRPVDDSIPFVPWTVLPYCFWFPLIAIYPLVLYRTDEYAYCTYMMTMIMEIMVSSFCYLLFPTSFQRPIPPDTFWGKFIRFIYRGSYRGLNCAPSLHCSSCFLVIWSSIICCGMEPWVRCLTIAIAVMIVLSTLTTKQHTLIDVITAVPLFLVCRIFGMMLALRYFVSILTFIQN